jgi:hypothetical protein
VSEAPNQDLLVALVVELPGLVIRDPFNIGPFELNTQIDTLPGCKEALHASWDDHGQAPIEDLKAAQLRLLRTYFKGVDSSWEAVKSARLHSQEALGLWTTQHFGMLDPPKVTGAGYVFDLRSGRAEPIRRQRQSRRRQGILAVMDDIAHQSDVTINSLLSVDPYVYGELGKALRRSTHWSHLAANTDDWTQQFLLSWMSMETLSRESIDENLGGKWLTALGFASGRFAKGLRAEDVQALSQISTYRHWRERLRDLFEKARVVRNSIAHAGFRELDIGVYLDDENKKLVQRVFKLLVPRLRALALNALALRIVSIEGMWGRYRDCLYLNRQVPLADEVGGTIIYSLEDKGGWL